MLLVAGAFGTTTVTRAASAVATPLKFTAAPAGAVGATDGDQPTMTAPLPS
jgi:hypothetical protein